MCQLQVYFFKGLYLLPGMFDLNKVGHEMHLYRFEVTVKPLLCGDFVHVSFFAKAVIRAVVVGKPRACRTRDKLSWDTKTLHACRVISHFLNKGS